MENDDTVDGGTEYGFYELQYVPLYQASGRVVAYGQRAQLTTTKQTTEQPAVIVKIVTPLETLRTSCAALWETEDGEYTCHGIRLDDGTRAVEYYSNETGELIAVVPMK